MPTDREQNFLKLVRANDVRLRRICRVYGHDAEGRKDLYQEILLQLWRSLPSFSGASSVVTWLYRVALNTALTYSRSRSMRREETLDQEYGDAGPPAIAVDAMEGRPDSAERLERLHAAIHRLGSVDKMLVTMYLDERSYREMADIIGISESHVGVKLHRIRKTLAAWLTEETV